MKRLTDPRTLALHVARDTFAGPAPTEVLLLPLRAPSEPVGFLVSLHVFPVRVVVPLAPGVNVIARSETLTQHRLPGPIALPQQAWPLRWCEGAQCHIYCGTEGAASVADRSSNGTALLPRDESPAFLPQSAATSTPFRYQVFGPRQERLDGSWQGDPCTWTSLTEGDVLVSVYSPWVFGWIIPTLRRPA